MVIQVVEFSSGGYKIRNILCLRINIPKGNYWILRIGAVASCQKLRINLAIKWFKNWCYQNMSVTKYVLVNWDFSMKKIKKIWMIFNIVNWLWKWHFLTPPHYTNSQNSMIFMVCWFLCQIDLLVQNCFEKVQIFLTLVNIFSMCSDIFDNAQIFKFIR